MTAPLSEPYRGWGAFRNRGGVPGSCCSDTSITFEAMHGGASNVPGSEAARLPAGPRPLLGLPRVVSTAGDLRALLDAAPSVANGLTFCTGSLGVRADNDLVAMAARFAPRIYFAHLRSTQREQTVERADKGGCAVVIQDKHMSPEEISATLREADVLLGQVAKVPISRII